MNGPAAEFESGGQPVKQVSEAKIWFGVVLILIILVIGSTAWGLCKGYDLVSAAAGPMGAALATLLSWGGFHLVSRRADDVTMLTSVSFFVVMAAFQRATFLAAFIITLFGVATGLTVVWVLSEFMRELIARWSKKAAPSRSDHVLYDADVDGAA
ncbi:hypothetical protein [Paludisphaera borealis]|uniref:Uncharacterized protein n=1 Tax=Paludisphaera borealis TaxID=1387353 RepID=A0A1U7CQG6_9BACT|nr:hypothetical protein [Paludisphaera borealis]APW61149.1 hypothetical protein BSF38_02653 [Paludisphaera borealis]